MSSTTVEWVRAVMMPCPDPSRHPPLDNLSQTVDDQRRRVTSPELCAATGATYRQVDHWTTLGLLLCEDPNPGSGRERSYPVSEVDVVARMVRLSQVGIPPAVAVLAARDDGWIAPGIRIVIDPSTPGGQGPLQLIEQPAEPVSVQ